MERNSMRMAEARGLYVMTHVADDMLQGFIEPLSFTPSHNLKTVYRTFLIKLDTVYRILKTVECDQDNVKEVRQPHLEYDLLNKILAVNNHFVKLLNKSELTIKGSGRVYIETLYEHGGGNLTTLKGIVTLPLLDTIVKQTLDALTFLEKYSQCHVEVTPMNIVQISDVVKFIKMTPTSYYEEKLRSISLSDDCIKQYRYCPPEVFLHAKKSLSVNKVDVYSWGMTLYQILANKSDDALAHDVKQLLFQPSNYPYFINSLRLLQIPGDSYGGFTKTFIAALEKALAFEPDERPNFTQLQALLGIPPSQSLPPSLLS